MSKSTLLFLGGAALGASITVAVFATGLFGGTGTVNSVQSDATGSNTDQRVSADQLKQLDELIANLGVTAGALKNSAETLMSAAFPVTLARNTPVTQQGQSSASASQDVSMSLVGGNNIAQPVVEPVQPTPAQIDRFTDIRAKLYDAASRPNEPLGDLIQLANDLTPEQRQQLTNEALDMVKRGELRAEQFMALPGS